MLTVSPMQMPLTWGTPCDGQVLAPNEFGILMSWHGGGNECVHVLKRPFMTFCYCDGKTEAGPLP